MSGVNEGLVRKAAESVPDAHWCESNFTKGCNCREYREEIARAVLEAVHDEIAAGALRDAADALNVDGVGFQDGWGSNLADQQTLGVMIKTLAWLRDRADRLTGGAS